MKDKRKDSLVKVIAKYSLSNIYFQILGVLNSFIRPKLLPPSLYGLWQILIVIPNYSSYTTLGTNAIMRYLIPYYDSQNEQQKIAEIRGTVFYGTLIPKVIIAIALIGVAVIANISLPVRFGLLTMSYLVIMEWYRDYYMTIMKSYQKFNLVTSINYVQATVAFVGSAILIYFLSIYGVYLAAVVTFIVLFLFIRSHYSLQSYGTFRYSLFLDLVKKGFPLMIYNLSNELMISADKIIIAYFLGTEQLGYYGIAIMVSGFLLQLPGASREVIEPRMMQELNEKTKEENLKEYFFKPLLNGAYFMPFLIGPVFFILPLAISLLLPKYIKGVAPTQIIALGGYFFALSYLFRGMIVANNWQMKASLITILILCINVGLSIAFITMGLGINGVAASSTISFFLLFIVLLIFIRKRSDYAQEEWRFHIKGICWPFPVMCIAIAFLQNILNIMSFNRYIMACLQLSVFYVIIFLLINYARKRYTLLKEIKISKLSKFL
jgi:O-antigen/teichoic acid export membrane protein